MRTASVAGRIADIVIRFVATDGTIGTRYGALLQCGPEHGRGIGRGGLAVSSDLATTSFWPAARV
ncbi:MAG: hypothetical protein R3E01_18000 [Pirellulaceae bacterium]|nr:hypothetical protein [Planctomycetales bacterium]